MLLKGKYKAFFLFLLVVALAIAAWLSTSLKFAAGFDGFLPSEDPQLVFYENAKKQFDSGESQMVIGIETDSNVFNQPFLRGLLQFEHDLMNLEGVTFANSIASLQNPVKGIFRVREQPFVHVEEPQ